MKNPEIRFADDNIDWQENSLGNMGKTFNGLTGKTKDDFGHGIAKYITYMNVYKNTIALPNEVDNIEIDDSQNQVIYGDILFTISSETPEEVGLSSVWLYNENNIYLNSFCFGYRPSNNIDHKFMGYLLRSNSVRKKIILLAQGISRYNISKNKVMEIKIFLPPLEIQKQISSLLFDIDQKINNLEVLIQKLKDTKSALLIKMFPRKNQSVPTLRFDGFTNDWEQRKLRDIAEFNPKSILPTTFEYVDLESVVGTEMISHRTETKHTAPSRAQRLAKTGDIFYQTVRPYQKNNFLFNKLENNYVFSTGYAQLRPCINSCFLMSFLQTENFVKTVLDNCSGTSYPAINSTDLSKLTIKLPKSQKEQEQIGILFNNLDKTITLHQCKPFHLNFSL